MITQFGLMPSGDPVLRIEIAAGGLSAAILTYGAILQDLRLDDFSRSLVLGLNSLDDYRRHSPCFGATVGRVANRLSFGAFELDGVRHDVDRNVNGVHTLHGGSNGLAVQNWQIADSGADFVVLEILSPDGEMGFPGNLAVLCRYSLSAEGSMNVVLTAKTDAPTPCNLVHHSYFNLEGEGDILSHRLMMEADEITEVDQELIPSGKVLAVVDTDYDFRRLRPISDGKADGTMRYDHNFCLSRQSVAQRPVALLKAPVSGIEMRLSTTMPGLQFYDGAKINCPVEGLDGRYYGANAGLCLETQHWPDAPNRPEFPGMILRPGETCHHASEYRFSRQTG